MRLPQHRYLKVQIALYYVVAGLVFVLTLAHVFSADEPSERITSYGIFLLAALLVGFFVQLVREELAHHEEQVQVDTSLAALQEITKHLNQSLDFSDVSQRLVNTAIRRFDYLSALVIMLDEDGRRLRPRVISQTPAVSAALKLLPKKLAEFVGTAEDDTLVAKAIRTGRVQQGNVLRDFVSPPLDVKLADFFQERFGVRGLVAVPILVEGRVVGVLLFALERTKETVDNKELETMKALADQLGVITRNTVVIEELKYLEQAKSDFIRIASHQIRTPISTTKGYISMMMDGDFGKITPATKKTLQKIYEANDQLIVMLNDLLHVSAIDAGKEVYRLRPTDVMHILRHAVQKAEPLARRKGITVHLLAPNRVPLVKADNVRLGQLFDNLLDNAVKYTPQGGIAVSVKSDKENKVVRVAIADTGIGLTADEKKYIFKKFARGETVSVIHTQGVGLGLYVVRKIVEAHRGRVWAESAGRGKGSVFYVELPFSNAY